MAPTPQLALFKESEPMPEPEHNQSPAPADPNHPLITRRCSSLPGMSMCPSYGDTSTPYNPESPAAQQGSAAHAAIEYYLENAEVPDFEQIKMRFPLIDLNDLRICFFMARNLWDDEILPVVGEDYETEIPMRATLGEVNGKPLVITGTADVLVITPDDIFVIDWKFGREVGKTNYFQLWGYAALAVTHLGGFRESGFVTTIEAHVRTKTWRENISHMDRANLSAFKSTLLAQAAKSGEVYNPSPTACKFCAARLECKEYRLMVADTVGAFVEAMGTKEAPEAGSSWETATTPAGLLAFHPSYKMLDWACKRYSELLKASLEGGGHIGKENAVEGFHLGERVTRAVDPRKAWPILKEAGLDDAGINKILKMSHSQVKNAIMKQEPPLDETKKSHWEKVNTALEDAGAVSSRSSYNVSK